MSREGNKEILCNDFEVLVSAFTNEIKATNNSDDEFKYRMVESISSIRMVLERL